jgi:hypothetical protein
VSKPSDSKAMDSESPSGLDTGENAWVAGPQEQQALGAKPQGASMLGKDPGVKAPRIAGPVRSKREGEAIPGVSPAGAVLLEGQSWCSQSIGDLTCDGRSPGVSNSAKARLGGGGGGKATGYKPCGRSPKVRQIKGVKAWGERSPLGQNPG